jgi:hypothetical protein
MRSGLQENSTAKILYISRKRDLGIGRLKEQDICRLKEIPLLENLNKI